MLATTVNEILTLGFFFWGDGSGAGFFLFFPILIIKFMFLAMLFGLFAGPRYRRPPRRTTRRRRGPQPDPVAEAERRQYEEDLRKAEDEVDSWTTYEM